jgi:hypothetical protein
MFLSFDPRTLVRVSAFSLISILTGCINPNDPSWSSGPSYGNTYGGGYNDPYYNNSYQTERERDRLRDARRDAERERDRLQHERERLNEDRARHEAEQRRRHEEQSRRREERCPSGFSPSENKCSREERQRGCRDMRLPGGLGCVSR